MHRVGARRRLVLWVLMILILVSLPVGVPAAKGAVEAEAPQAPQKVSSAAWSATAGGDTPDLWVILNDQASLPEPEMPASKAERVRRVYETLWRAAQTSQAPVRAWLDRRGVTYQSFYIVNALLVRADRDLLRALVRRPEVAHVVTNPQIAVDVPRPDEGFAGPAPAGLSLSMAVPWGVDHIGAPAVWALGVTGEGVVVAGQDTGYAWTHPALRNQYRGWDGVSADHDYNWHDAIHTGGGDCGPDAPAPCDDHGHGTHTMGTIVGDDGADRQIGVAPGARWIGCRNMSQGVGTPATYAECYQFFLAPYPVGGDPSQGDPAMAPDVVNNSWGCPPYEGCDAVHIWLLELVVERLRDAGIVVVSSAGNHGPSCGSVDEPSGMYDAAYTVGATADVNDTIAGFSSRGTGTALIKPDIVAPGVSVLSSVRSGGYGYLQGTSMAAPHVTGALALLWSARPDLRGQVAASETVLNEAAIAHTSTWCGDAPGAVPNNVYGWGRLDILAPVQAAVQPSRFAEVRASSLVSAAIGSVVSPTLTTLVAELSGERAITVTGQPYTLTTRYSLAPEAIAAAEFYARAYFEGLGLPTACHAYTLYQATRCNIIAEQAGALEPDRVVLLTAHLDATSMDSDPMLLAPGADDNASGTAAVMAAARALRAYDLPYTVRYALFTGEEQGLYGSAAYARDLAAAGEELAAVLNLDMVGYNSADKPAPTMRLYLRSDDAGDWAIARVFTQVVGTYGLDLVPWVTPSGMGRSDHASFWQQGYAAVLAIEDHDYEGNFNPHYHTSSDRLDKLDLDYLTAFARTATGAAMHMGGVVDFVHQPLTVGVGSPVTFTVVSHLVDEPLAYTWDFGGGDVSSGEVVNHTFAVGDDAAILDHRVVTLTVEHEAGTLAVVRAVPVLGRRVYLPLIVRP